MGAFGAKSNASEYYQILDTRHRLHHHFNNLLELKRLGKVTYTEALSNCPLDYFYRLIGTPAVD